MTKCEMKETIAASTREFLQRGGEIEVLKMSKVKPKTWGLHGPMSALGAKTVHLKDRGI